MSNKSDFERLHDKIVSIPENRQASPNSIPIDVYIQEAENLFDWAYTDREALIARGMSPVFLDELPIRCGALSYAQSAWITSSLSTEESRMKWNKDSPAAYELRDDLLSEFKFAYRDHENLLKRVKEIAEGTAHADMLQDLNDLAMLGRKNPLQLELTNFDTGLLDKAEKISDTLSALLAAATTEKKQDNRPRIIRDMAYTYLKKAVDEVRSYGRFVFRKNDERLKGYRSDYLRKANKRRASKKEARENKVPVSSAV